MIADPLITGDIVAQVASTQLKRIFGIGGFFHACFAPPICRVQLFAWKNATGNRGDKRDASWTWLNVSKNGQQFFANGIHVVRVESIINPQHADEFVILLEPFDKFFEWLSITTSVTMLGLFMTAIWSRSMFPAINSLASDAEIPTAAIRPSPPADSCNRLR